MFKSVQVLLELNCKRLVATTNVCPSQQKGEVGHANMKTNTVADQKGGAKLQMFNH